MKKCREIWVELKNKNTGYCVLKCSRPVMHPKRFRVHGMHLGEELNSNNKAAIMAKIVERYTEAGLPTNDLSVNWEGLSKKLTRLTEHFQQNKLHLLNTRKNTAAERDKAFAAQLDCWMNEEQELLLREGEACAVQTTMPLASFLTAVRTELYTQFIGELYRRHYIVGRDEANCHSSRQATRFWADNVLRALRLFHAHCEKGNAQFSRKAFILYLGQRIEIYAKQFVTWDSKCRERELTKQRQIKSKPATATAQETL